MKMTVLESMLNLCLGAVQVKGAKSGKSCHPRGQKIYPKSRFGRKYFENNEKAKYHAIGRGGNGVVSQMLKKAK